MLSNLQKLVVVCGVGNSGKSTSIKLAISELLVEILPSRRADIAVIAIAHKDGLQCWAGFASGGDDAETVAANWNFFKRSQSKVNFLVMACKKSGGSREKIESLAKKSRIVPVFVETSKRKDSSEFENDNLRVVAEILKSFSLG